MTTLTWTYESLEDVCSLITDGSHFSPKTAATGDFPYITVRDIKGTDVDFSQCQFISEISFKELQKNGCQPDLGDVLFSKDGTVGKVAIVKDPRPFVVLSSLAILRPNSNLITPEFLAYVLQSPTVLEDALGMKTGTAIRRVVLRNLKKLLIPLPPLEEQRRIVESLDDHLSRLDKALAEVSASLLKFETLERSAMAMHFSTSEVSGGVKQSRIADVTEKAKSIDPKTLGLDTFRYVDIGSISPDSETPQVLEWTPVAVAPSRARQHIKEGDVVFSTVRPYQKKIAIVKEDFDGHIASTGFCVLRPNPSVLDTRYLYHYLKSDALMDQVLPLQRGASYPAVGDSDVKNSSIPLPDLATQRAIAAALDSVVGTVKSLKSQLQDISMTVETMRRSILHSAFSGTLLEEK